MKPRRLFLFIALVLAGVAAIFVLFETPNHKRIRFYGVVVDQNGQPVAGASVYLTVYYNSISGQGMKRAIIPSGQDGRFEISGYKGRTLDIGLSKEGYDYEGDTGPFQYTELVGEKAQFHPDETKPVKFVMWKRRGAEPMVTGRINELRLPYDGSETRLDFLKGGIVKEGGDLIFRLSAPTPLHANSWDWDFEIAAVPGGLIASRMKLMSEAPQEGYIPKINLGHKMSEEHWWGQAKGDYFARTRDQIYSKFHIYFTGNPAFGPGTLTIRWQTNPAGSRNLEYDENKDVSKQYRDKK